VLCQCAVKVALASPALVPSPIAVLAEGIMKALFVAKLQSPSAVAVAGLLVGLTLLASSWRLTGAAASAASVAAAENEVAGPAAAQVADDPRPPGRRVNEVNQPAARQAIPPAADPRTWQAHDHGVDALAFSPDGRHLASASLQAIKIWNVESGKEIALIKDARQSVKSLAFTADGKRLVAGTLDADIRIYDFAKKELLKTIVPGDTVIHKVAVNPQGTLIASAGREKVLKIWDLVTGKLVHGIDAHPRDVQSVAFSPDGRTLASCGYDSHVKLWDAANGQAIQTFENAGLQIHWDAVAFSPNGRYLCAVGAALRVIDLATGFDRFNVKADDVQTLCVAVNPAGAMVATGGMNRLVRIWDADSGKEVQQHAGHQGDITDLAFSPDGRWLASASKDRTIRLWPMNAKPLNPAPRDKKGDTHEGRVQEIRDGLALINLGTDQGLDKGDLLEVFRLEPAPAYVGQARVLEVQPARAVVRPVGKTISRIKVNDRVTRDLGQR
jgi:DNA-binding beta-propeller fold protein YncE